jgi:hypothetical protein
MLSAQISRRRTCAAQMSLWGFLVCVVALFLPPLLNAQEIRIRVLNARNGKPVTDECVNVSLGSWHGGDLIAPTNKDGLVVLRFENGQVSANAGSPHACNGLAVLGPRPVPAGVDTLAITSDEYIDCQEWAKVIPGEAPKDALNRAPSYPIQRILESGAAAGNRCGKFRADTKRGEVIFYVRPRSFLEKMRK